MRDFLNRTVLRIRMRLTNDPWARALAGLQLLHPAHAKRTSHGAELGLWSLMLPEGQFTFIIEEYERLMRLKEGCGAHGSIKDNRFYLTIGKLVLSITSAEEIFVAEEVFLKEVYSFQGGFEYNVIDVGMNVGFGSLFFATRKAVKRVYAFEPFEETCRQAEINYSLNATYATRIERYRYGLGEKSEERWVDYDYANKAQAGIHGTAFVKSAIRDSRKQKMVIRQASGEVMRIVGSNPGNYLLKLDCEGAEYMILRNLDQQGVLPHMSALIVEWHEEGPGPLVEILLRNGFAIFSQREAHKSLGMIYACKKT